MLNKLPSFTIIAHRGSSSFAPENTISAFNLAIHQHAHAIEFDVMLSADKNPVVIHDHTVDRTTNGNGAVRDMYLADLQALDAGSFFDVQFKDEKIPTLEEVLIQIGGKIFINIELKNLVAPFDPLPSITANLVKEYGLEDDVIFSSFNPLALFKIKKSLPKSDTALLIWGGLYGRIIQHPLIKIIPHKAVHLNYEIINTKLIDMLHRSERRVLVYTVDDVNEMKKLYAMGVDGIFTNDPLSARKMLDAMEFDQKKSLENDDSN